jgi:hypothetical protein
LALPQHAICHVTKNQGDQIGQTFICLGGVYFGHFLFVNYKSSANFWTTFFRVTSYGPLGILTQKKNWARYIFGNLFTSSSGHPAKNSFSRHQHPQVITDNKAAH